MNYLAFTCTSASDNSGRHPSHHDGSGGGHGRFELDPLSGISSVDTWASSSLRNEAGGGIQLRKSTWSAMWLLRDIKIMITSLPLKFEISPIHAHAHAVGGFGRGDKEEGTKRRGGVRRDDRRRWVSFVVRLLLYLILSSKDELIDSWLLRSIWHIHSATAQATYCDNTGHV